MTDSEKLDLLLDKLVALEGDVAEIKSKMATKRQLMEATAKLKGMDELILDEVERVHEILDRHVADKSAHTA